MRYSVIFLVLLTALLGCQPEKKTSAVELTWSSQPAQLSQGPGSFTLNLNKDGAPLVGAQIEFEATMTHPGMVPVLGSAKEVQPGQYQLDLVTTMAGSWVMFLKIKTTDGELIEKDFNFDIAR